MRLLLAIHNAYTDGNSGAARSVRTMVEWLAEAGHECRVLCSARFDATPPASLQQHLKALAISTHSAKPPKAFIAHLRKCDRRASPRPVLRYTVNEVPVTQVITRANSLGEPSRTEYEQLVFHFDDLVAGFQPDVVLSYGAHPVVREFLRRAQAHGASTVFTVRNHGYNDQVFYAHADNVLMTSPYLARLYREKTGLHSTGIASPIRWEHVVAPTESRAFVTLVNPGLQKGLTLFARLADMLGSTRPDIPLLVVQSAATAHVLNRIPGIDFSRYPQIQAAPATQLPADYLALTRILLVPSLFDEPFGRVAAEALINGIPALVSNRGALPETVGEAGTVLPVPNWLTKEETALPTEEEVLPWYNAVCSLWDDPEHYARCSEKSRIEGEKLYGEAQQRQLYERYFNAARHTPGLIDREGWE